MVLKNSVISIPAVRTIFGTRDALVIPGIVLISGSKVRLPPRCSPFVPNLCIRAESILRRWCPVRVFLLLRYPGRAYFVAMSVVFGVVVEVVVVCNYFYQRQSFHLLAVEVCRTCDLASAQALVLPVRSGYPRMHTARRMPILRLWSPVLRRSLILPWWALRTQGISGCSLLCRRKI